MSDFNKLKVYIHVAMMNNWDAILHELLEDIRISKLDQSAEVTLVTVGGSLLTHYNADRTFNTELPLTAFEFPTLERLYDELEDNTAVCYCHLKGVSTPFSLGHRHWRREMSEFTIINWKQRVHHLTLNWTSGPRITHNGAGWHSDYIHANKHYSGNFWWARSDYLKSLPNPATFNKNRYSAEAWIGQNPLINEPIK